MYYEGTSRRDISAGGWLVGLQQFHQVFDEDFPDADEGDDDYLEM